jgi:hypothetical protein
MTEFQPGDRVQTVAKQGAVNYRGTIVGPSSAFGGFYVVEWEGSTPARVRHDQIELIPDTVTVTVELPRDEAEATASYDPLPDALGGPVGDACERFRIALLKALP